MILFFFLGIYGSYVAGPGFGLKSRLEALFGYATLNDWVFIVDVGFMDEFIRCNIILK